MASPLLRALPSALILLGLCAAGAQAAPGPYTPRADQERTLCLESRLTTRRGEAEELTQRRLWLATKVLSADAEGALLEARALRVRAKRIDAAGQTTAYDTQGGAASKDSGAAAARALLEAPPLRFRIGIRGAVSEVEAHPAFTSFWEREGLTPRAALQRGFPLLPAAGPTRAPIRGSRSLPQGTLALTRTYQAPGSSGARPFRLEAKLSPTGEEVWALKQHRGQGRVVLAEGWPREQELELELELEAGSRALTYRLRERATWTAGHSAVDAAEDHDVRVGDVFVYALKASGTQMEMRYEVRVVEGKRIRYDLRTIVLGNESLTEDQVWELPASPQGKREPASGPKTERETISLADRSWTCMVAETRGTKTWVPLTADGLPTFPPVVRVRGPAMELDLVRIERGGQASSSPKTQPTQEKAANGEPGEQEESAQEEGAALPTEVDLSTVKVGQVYRFEMIASGMKIEMRMEVKAVTKRSVRYDQVTVVMGNETRNADQVWEAPAEGDRARQQGAGTFAHEAIDLAGQRWKTLKFTTPQSEVWVPLRNGKLTFPPFLKTKSGQTTIELAEVSEAPK